MDGRVDGWMDGRVDGWMDGWRDGWMDDGVTMKTGGFSCGKREFITRSNTQREIKRSFP